MLAFAAAQSLMVRERAGPGCPDGVARTGSPGPGCGGRGPFWPAHEAAQSGQPCPAVAGVPSIARLRGAVGGIEAARPGQHYNRRVSREDWLVFGVASRRLAVLLAAGWFAPADWPARQHHTSLRKPLIVPTSQGTGETLFGDPLRAMAFRVWFFVAWFVLSSVTYAGGAGVQILMPALLVRSIMSFVPLPPGKAMTPSGLA